MHFRLIGNVNIYNFYSMYHKTTNIFWLSSQYEKKNWS